MNNLVRYSINNYTEDDNYKKDDNFIKKNDKIDILLIEINNMNYVYSEKNSKNIYSLKINLDETIYNFIINNIEKFHNLKSLEIYNDINTNVVDRFIEKILLLKLCDNLSIDTIKIKYDSLHNIINTLNISKCVLQRRKNSHYFVNSIKDCNFNSCVFYGKMYKKSKKLLSNLPHLTSLKINECDVYYFKIPYKLKKLVTDSLIGIKTLNINKIMLIENSKINLIKNNMINKNCIKYKIKCDEIVFKRNKIKNSHYICYGYTKYLIVNSNDIIFNYSDCVINKDDNFENFKAKNIVINFNLDLDKSSGIFIKNLLKIKNLEKIFLNSNNIRKKEKLKYCFNVDYVNIEEIIIKKYIKIIFNNEDITNYLFNKN